MLRFLTILSLVVLSVRLFMSGLLNSSFLTIALLAVVAAMAFGRAGRILAASVGGLLLLAQLLSNGDSAMRGQVIQSILVLALVLLGIYVILGGKLRRSKR